MRINDIKNRKSIEALNKVLHGYVLENFQTVDALTAVLQKRTVIGHDTGLGKTLVASAIMRMLTNEIAGRKFLFICKRAQFTQTPVKIREATKLKVTTISSERASLENNLYTGKFLESDIIIIAEEVFDDDVAVAVLLTTLNRITGIFVDEIHTMCNFTESHRAAIIKGLLKHVEYAIGLTATPMTSDIQQWCKILAMIEPAKFSNWRDTLHLLQYNNLNLDEISPAVYLKRTRLDLGISNLYNNHIHLVPAMEHQIDVKGKELFKTCKGNGAFNQVNKLIEILNMEQGKGIVYIRHHDTRKFVCKELDRVGIKYDCINGLTPSRERKRVMDAYNKNEIDLVITSTTSSIDLDGDYVVLYEYTCELRQILGRLERGLIPKEIQVHYIFTEDTGEFDYFIEKIYKRSLILQTILKRDYAMILEIGKKINRKRKQC